MRRLVGVLSLLLAIHSHSQVNAQGQLQPAIFRSANKSVGSKTIRGLLRARQVTCDPGFGLCRTGGCCPVGGDCCSDGQSSPVFMYNDPIT